LPGFCNKGQTADVEEEERRSPFTFVRERQTGQEGEENYETKARGTVYVDHILTSGLAHERDVVNETYVHVSFR
jgi:hypothetical protein